MPSNSQYRPLTKRNVDAPFVTQANKALTIVGAIFVFICIVASLGPNASSGRSGASTGGGRPRRLGRGPSCDPFALPGYVSRLGSTTGAPRGLATWRTFDVNCASSALLPALLDALPSSSTHHLASPPARGSSAAIQAALLEPLRNSTALMLGDRHDTALLRHFCDIVGAKVEAVDARHPWGAALKNVPKSHRWPNNDAAALKLGVAPDEREAVETGDKVLAHYCYLPEYDFLLTSAYHYGTDMTSRWHSLPSYVSPSLFEDRVTDLFIPYISALTNVKPAARPPTLPPARTRLDLVLFASTSWDLAGWTKDDLAAGRPAASDLDETRLVEWRARSVDMLSALDKAFPRASIAWRSEGVPLKSEAETLEMWTGDKADSTTQPLLTSNRAHALSHARTSILAPPRAGDTLRGSLDRLARMPRRVRSMPYGEAVLGQPQADHLEATLDSGGALFTEMLLHQLSVAAAGY